jgi:hypothetical protein
LAIRAIICWRFSSTSLFPIVWPLRDSRLRPFAERGAPRTDDIIVDEHGERMDNLESLEAELGRYTERQ